MNHLPILSLKSLNGLNGLVIQNTRRGQRTNEVSFLGDINRDGWGDLFIGVRFSGAGYFIFGAPNYPVPSLSLSELDPEFGFNSYHPTLRFFRGRAGVAGDLNGDGVLDLFSAEPFSSANGTFSGQVTILFNSPEGFSSVAELRSLNEARRKVKIDGIDKFDQLGLTRPVGDINNDGIDDLMIGSSFADSVTGTSDSNPRGQSYVIFGQSSGFPAKINLQNLKGQDGFTLNGAEPYGRAGVVSGPGDLNGDGIDDMVIGAWGNGGQSYIIFGSEHPFDRQFNLGDLAPSQGVILNRPEGTDEFGRQISRLGDVNGDGISDFIVTARSFRRQLEMPDPESYVIFGSSVGFNATLDVSQLDGTNGFIVRDTTQLSAHTVTDLGDFNGDGLDDIFIGTGGASRGGQVRQGGGYVIWGSNQGVDPVLSLADLGPEQGLFIQGELSRDLAGSFASGGDINGDGLSDLLVGAPRSSKREAGRSYIVFGRPINQAESIVGSSGRDLLSGFDGQDTILGLEGDDILSGNRDRDRLDGGDGNDILRGGAGNDNLVGGAGHDRLIGGSNRDRLTGGLGQDEFIYQHPEQGGDRILDFEVDQDVISLKRDNFGGLLRGQLQHRRFSAGLGATERDDRIIYNDQTGQLLFDANGSSAGGDVEIAVLEAGLKLTAANIRVF